MFGSNLKTILLALILDPNQLAMEQASKVGYDLNYGYDIPYQKFRSPKDAGNYVIQYINSLCFQLGWNRFKFRQNIRICSNLIVINNRTCKIVEFDPYTKRFVLKRCIPITKFYNEYVYIGIGNYRNNSILVCATSELEAFRSLNVGTDLEDQMLVYKISVHKFGKPDECMEELSIYGNRLYDDIFYYDILDYINKDSSKLYDYLMRLIQYERIQYDHNGDRIRSDWVYGWIAPKGMSDFYTPDIYQRMIESGDPFRWDHEYEDVINYGNVLTDINTTLVAN